MRALLLICACLLSLPASLAAAKAAFISDLSEAEFGYRK